MARSPGLELGRSVTKRHEDLVISTAESPAAAARSMVAASWRRSLVTYGLDPRNKALPYRLPEQQLREAVEARAPLLKIANPYLDEIFRAIGRSGCAMLLSDKDGVVLEKRVNSGDAREFEQSGLGDGSVWSERHQGTNGIGTALVENRPVIIHHDQHFFSKNTSLSCVGTPIYDEQGELVAALDVSSCRADHTDAAAFLLSHLVNNAAKRIETDFFCHKFDGYRIVMAPDSGRQGPTLFAVDQDDLVVGATRRARDNFDLTNELLRAGIPVADLLAPEHPPSSLAEAERAEMRRAIARANGNMTTAAKALGVSRATLYRRLRNGGTGPDAD